MRIYYSKQGSILILSLWVLALLGIFAAQIGLHVRQRATLMTRLEQRSQLRLSVRAGVQKAIAALRSDLEKNKEGYSSYSKFYRHNNPLLFGSKELANTQVEVSYLAHDRLKAPQKRFGFVDEDGKLNVNFADRHELQRLFLNVLQIKPEQAAGLAEAVLDWRSSGIIELLGFYSDDYYTNLQYPYRPKDGPFELLDELRLVRGISPEIFEQIRPFVTVYGDGRVNINTAPYPVLIALGLSDQLAQKIFLVRRGFDEVENTVDDYIFHKTFDVASEMLNFIEMEVDEIKYIDRLNLWGKIKTDSSFYFIESRAALDLEPSTQHLTAFCVYNAAQNRIEYWREKN